MMRTPTPFKPFRSWNDHQPDIYLTERHTLVAWFLLSPWMQITRVRHIFRKPRLGSRKLTETLNWDGLPHGELRRAVPEGDTRVVYYRRTGGPGVVLMHEIPGITPQVAALGTRLADAGFSVAMPSLFGEDVRLIPSPLRRKSFSRCA